MHPLAALLLGLVQGITEFLPISSSAHLALLEHYFHVSGGGLSFDILLHVGTLAALLGYFYQDWLEMGHAFIFPTRYNRPERRLLFFLIIAVIPGAIAGVLLEHKAETVFREPARIALLMGGVGLLLILAEKIARHVRHMDQITFKDALYIGLSQALAIMPGVSRSGITMTTGLFLGLNRRSAAHFSFLLATPIIAGAGLYHLPKWFKEGNSGELTLLPAVLGFLAAVISSYLTIKYLLRFLQRHTFIPFAVYRLIVAAIILTLAVLRPSW
ncbi:MAG: undecaprenyl-diphosphatase UppP [Deltaproteobacteria bacterium]|nr:undecaprenyl-diphosphatase UppP [Deltaproteobacteria bacterium]